MTTLLTRALSRELLIAGRPFVVTLSRIGIDLTPKGKRNAVRFRWEELAEARPAEVSALSRSLSEVMCFQDKGVGSQHLRKRIKRR
jgi:hypothetical protein